MDTPYFYASVIASLSAMRKRINRRASQTERIHAINAHYSIGQTAIQ